MTGGAKGIGRAIAQEFRKAGAAVCVIDLLPNDYFVGDVSDRAVLEEFARKVIAEHGHVDYLINNALPLMKGIDACSWEEFNYALRVGVTAPFYLTKLFAPHFAKVRVNSISPGWIETGDTVWTGPDADQQPAGRVGDPLDIANMVLFLCSDKAGFITGENICIDGGMTRQMIYHNDFGWTFEGGGNA